MVNLTGSVHPEMAASDTAGHAIDLDVARQFAELVDGEPIVQAVAATLRQEGVDVGAVAVVITDDETIQQLNRTYRGVDAPTDVLSFPARESGETAVEPALPPELGAELGAYLGDLVIAYPYAARQARHHDNSLAAELCLLAVHGTLHLLGYDHATPAEQARMWAAQDAVLARFGYAGIADNRAD